MSKQLLAIAISFGYLLLLFLLAGWAERFARKGKSLVNNPLVYALSLAVYCTAWTYYGSVGRAANGGLSFLSTYMGPILSAPLWVIVLRKIIRICKVRRITTIADFISARYGHVISLGMLVTVLCLLAVIPYISIQIKAISNSFMALSGNATTGGASVYWVGDTAFYIALALAAFSILFGTRKIDATERHEGLVSAIAFESIVKLVAFLLIGSFVTFGLFDGFADVFKQAAAETDLQALFTLNQEEGYGNWFWLNGLAMLAFFMLPRQFQVAVKENVDERHISKAAWLFPLYLLLINLFVLPIALGGKLLFAGQAVDADMYVLALPLQFDQPWLAFLAYLGGFSAATSMIIVSTTALSVMVSNNLIMPVLAKQKFFAGERQALLPKVLLWIRRLSIPIVLLMAYLYFRGVADRFPLVSIGLISFVGVAQFAPAVLGGIFWKEGSRQGALAGLIAGFACWFYTLVLPTMVEATILPGSMLADGLFGLSWLRPQALLGLEGMSPVLHGMFWSLSANAVLYILVSHLSRQNSQEQNQAAIFVDIFDYARADESSIVWKGSVQSKDLRQLLVNVLGESRSGEAMAQFDQRFGQAISVQEHADPRLVNYVEKLLAGAVGSASARVIMASLSKEEEISTQEVFTILREARDLMSTNKALQQKSAELKRATEQLKEMNLKLVETDRLKDEFISTVTHEMRTPLTAIKAFAEILQDNDDLPPEQQQQFLETITRETERMGRLIDQVLDLERYQSGSHKLELSPCKINELIQEAMTNLGQVAEEKQIMLEHQLATSEPLVLADRDRLLQVLLNLLSNAIKFSPEKGNVLLRSHVERHLVWVEVIDNGKGLDANNLELIFEPFFQATDQNSKKPKGSGLGLAISRKIIEHHRGIIEAKPVATGGACLRFCLPALKQPGASDYVQPDTTQLQHGKSNPNR